VGIQWCQQLKASTNSGIGRTGEKEKRAPFLSRAKPRASRLRANGIRENGDFSSKRIYAVRSDIIENNLMEKD